MEHSHEYYMERAKRVAQFSPGKTTKVGCVIVPVNDNRVIETACDFPKNVYRLDSRLLKPQKYLWLEHAERRGMYEAAARGIALRFASMYLPWFPCAECARGIVDCEIARLYAHEPDYTDPTWGESFRVAHTILREGMVDVHIVGKGRP